MKVLKLPPGEQDVACGEPMYTSKPKRRPLLEYRMFYKKHSGRRKGNILCVLSKCLQLSLKVKYISLNEYI